MQKNPQCYRPIQVCARSKMYDFPPVYTTAYPPPYPNKWDDTVDAALLESSICDFCRDIFGCKKG